MTKIIVLLLCLFIIVYGVVCLYRRNSAGFIMIPFGILAATILLAERETKHYKSEF